MGESGSLVRARFGKRNFLFISYPEAGESRAVIFALPRRDLAASQPAHGATSNTR